MAKHAPISPSHVYRVMACPGSVRMCAGRPRKSSKYAAEGTAAHKLGELCLLKGLDAVEFLGATIDTESDGSWPVTQEMADAVQQYLDEVRRMQKLIGGRLEVEVRVDLTSMIPDMFGTCDAAIIEEFGRGVVIDYKNGKKLVDPFWNEQMMLYGLGLALKYDLTSIIMVIVQPHVDPSVTGAPDWRQFELSTDELKAGVQQSLLPVLEMAKGPDAPLAAGDHCTFCDAKTECPEIRRQKLEAAQVAFDDDIVPLEAQPTLPAPRTLTNAQLGRVVQVMRMVSTWADEVEELLHERLETGEASPEEAGFKLVQGRASRKWANEELALSTCFNLIRGDAYEAPKLKSVAQMEKAFKAKGVDFAKAADLVAVSRGVSLAPLDDKRPAILPATTQFGSVEDF